MFLRVCGCGCGCGRGGSWQETINRVVRLKLLLAHIGHAFEYWLIDLQKKRCPYTVFLRRNAGQKTVYVHCFTANNGVWMLFFREVVYRGEFCMVKNGLR